MFSWFNFDNLNKHCQEFHIRTDTVVLTNQQLRLQWSEVKANFQAHKTIHTGSRTHNILKTKLYKKFLLELTKVCTPIYTERIVYYKRYIKDTQKDWCIYEYYSHDYLFCKIVSLLIYEVGYFADPIF